MKLWLKISLICIIILMLIIGVCSTILLIQSRESILQITMDNIRTEQHNLQASFSEMVNYYGNYYDSDNLEPVVKRSMLKYCFSLFANNTSVLIYGDETIYSNISLLPEKILPLSESYQQKLFIGKIDGRHILIAGNNVGILSDECKVYTVRDITSVYTDIRRMALQFIAISLACIMIGTGLIIFLVRFATRHLEKLGSSARRIANGKYDERTEIASNDEVGALARNFNIMAEAVEMHIDELEKAAERQRIFIGGLTHEFKTPLTSVIGHSETLLYTKLPEDVAYNSLIQIHDQCKWLERLTQKLLALITLQENITLREESVTKLLNAVKDNVDETFKQRKTNIKITCGIDTLYMDFDLMLSAVTNLADNGSKASSAGQTVEISAYSRTIQVRDHGKGIPRNEIEKITEPFYMVDRSRNKKNGGSGLGLALVKQITDAHHAGLVFESEPGKGTTVKIIFP